MQERRTMTVSATYQAEHGDVQAIAALRLAGELEEGK
jgi:hypothetical protein